jgi:hypothetical protein
MSVDLVERRKKAGPLSPRLRVTAPLWDVNWHEDGYGKHGRGPFATKRQAQACLRAVGWPGTVELVNVTLELADLEMVYARAPK